jgi:hypothetical protein
MKTETSLIWPALDPAAVPARTGSIYPTEELRALTGDCAHYPDADLEARAARGGYGFHHKDGTPY